MALTIMRLVGLALLLTLAFTLPIALIRAQPYDTSRLKRLLVPPTDCEIPCLLGIQPGITPAAQVQTILAAQATIAQVVREPDTVNVYTIHWQCAGGPCDCRTQVRVLTDADQIVSWLRVADPCVRLGDLLPYLGTPVHVTYFNRHVSASQPIIFDYPQQQVVLYLPTSFCEIDQAHFWTRDLLFGIIVTMADFDFVHWVEQNDLDRSMGPVTRHFDRTSWAYQLRRYRPAAWRVLCG